MNTTIEKNKVKHHLKLMINISISKYESDLRMNEHYLGVVKKRPERNSGLYGIWTSAKLVFGQLSQYFNKEFVIMLLRYRPVKWWINDWSYKKIMYVNCGLRNDWVMIIYIDLFCNCLNTRFSDNFCIRCSLHSRLSVAMATEVILL